MSDNWAAYWYEGPSLPEPTLTVYGSDGVENPPAGKGFQGSERQSVSTRSISRT